MLPKGEYRVRISLDYFGSEEDDEYYCVEEVEDFVDVKDFLDVHHRGLISQKIDDLRDDLIRNVFKSDYERTA